MADVEVTKEVSVTTPKKAKKTAAPKKVASATTADAPAKPKTSEMVVEAIRNLKERSGSSLIAIKKYMASQYLIDPEKTAHYIRRFLRQAVESGALVQVKGKGASGSFKLPPNAAKPKKEAKPKPEKPKKAATEKKVPKDKKAAGEKKAKKIDGEKKEKVKAKKPAAEKKEKVKKPAAEKKEKVVKAKEKTTKTSKKPTAASKPKTPKPKTAAATAKKTVKVTKDAPKKTATAKKAK